MLEFHFMDIEYNKILTILLYKDINKHIQPKAEMQIQRFVVVQPNWTMGEIKIFLYSRGIYLYIIFDLEEYISLTPGSMKCHLTVYM